MLKTLGLFVAGLVVVVVGLVAWLYIRAARVQRRAYGALLDRIAPVMQDLARGETPQSALPGDRPQVGRRGTGSRQLRRQS